MKYVPLIIMCILAILVLVLCPGCASIWAPQDPNLEQKLMLRWCTEEACHEGAGVVPLRSEYILEIGLRDESKIEEIIFATCHRIRRIPLGELERGKLNWWDKIWGKKREGQKWTYNPSPGIEDTGTCDLRIYTLDSKSEEHAFGIMRIHGNPTKYNLKGFLFCNGDGGKRIEGVSVCSGRAGTRQIIRFQDPVTVVMDDEQTHCKEPYPVELGLQIILAAGDCSYRFLTIDGRQHSLLTHGWKAIPFKL